MNKQEKPLIPGTRCRLSGLVACVQPPGGGNLSISIQRGPDGSYRAQCLTLNGVVGFGDTFEACLVDLAGAVEQFFERQYQPAGGAL